MEVTKEYIQKAEADMLLETAIKVSVVAPVKPKFWQFWKREIQVRHTFHVKPLTIAQQQRIVGRLSALDESPFHNNDNIMKAYNKLAIENMEDVIYCAAVLITDPRKEPEDQTLQFVKDNFNNNDMESLWAVMAKQLYIAPFLNGIVLIKGIDLSKTNPSD